MRKAYKYRGSGPKPRLNSDVLNQRSDLALKVAQIAAHWNVLQSSMHANFLMLLAGEEEAAFTIYYEVLTGQAYQRQKAFNAIAKARGLPEELLAEIKEIGDAVESLGKMRGDVVHALWATTEDRPNSLLAVKSQVEWVRNVHAFFGWRIAVSKGLAKDFQAPELQTITEYWEYTLSDLEDVARDIINLDLRVKDLHGKIATHTFARDSQPPWQRAESIVRRLRRERPSARSEEEAPPPKPPPEGQPPQ